MELEDDSSRLVHRADADQSPNYWVWIVLLLLWVTSLALYVPGMPT